MIIDCHGHYTTAPKELTDYRDKQKNELKNDPLIKHLKGEINITDEQLKESIVNNQLKLQTQRGSDLTIFSPRASRMEHHIGNLSTSIAWTEHCNDLIGRIVGLFPKNFVGVAQLPQSQGESLEASIKELERCVNDLGFIGLNLNPDPSGGYFNDVPPLDDKYWYPLYEKMVELEVPAMIHVSGCCNDTFHATSSYYLGADTTAFTQLFMSKTLFKDFPSLKFIIPHGGGAVPYHWGRYRGFTDMLALDHIDKIIENNIYFDTCVYHQEGIDLLVDVVPTKNILFASEMIGAVRGIDPQTGHYFDDTKRYITDAKISDEKKKMIFEDNIRTVFPRINAHIKKYCK
ncbi:MAG: amidohydrolase [Campylobacteraceae bacterium]|nr:amidohydrolase [Campylobacteraceae bacterium]